MFRLTLNCTSSMIQTSHFLYQHFQVIHANNFSASIAGGSDSVLTFLFILQAVTNHVNVHVEDVIPSPSPSHYNCGLGRPGCFSFVFTVHSQLLPLIADIKYSCLSVGKVPD